ncbi:MAG: S16 family serine protease [Microthrixaceae bacterium]
MTEPIVPSETVDEEEPSVADEPTTDEPTVDEPTGKVRRVATRRHLWTTVAVLLSFVAISAAAFLIKLPYHLIQPGSVRPAEQRIEVEGAPSYETRGEVLFTTVYLTQATPALMVRAWLDDAIEVRTEEEMYPDGDREGSRREARQRMDLSKLVATRVALEQVGIDAAYVADGTRVLGVVEGGPSDGVISVDDVIVGVDGGEVALPDDIGDELSDRAPGDTVDVELERPDGGQVRSEIVLGESADQAGRPILGVEVEPANPSLDTDVVIEVDSGDVSGPSAGLAWTLAIVDRLTPGSLTDGRRIAVTGEIRDDGSVGPIGGITQKVAAVKRAGIEVFIYPTETPHDEQEAMARVAGDDVTLWPVADIDATIERLAPDGLPSAD